MRTVQKALPESLTPDLIAPCGMNCGLCRGHLRDKNRCPGCNGDDAAKPRYCLTCKIKTCDTVASGASSSCFDCTSFPCARLNQLDKRYRSKYFMSVTENLLQIQEIGLELFVAAEKLRWACPECGSLLCVHLPDCGVCGHPRNPSGPADEGIERNARR
ncbi:MAG: DUF3795 domain-containing protein [Coriobacteriia bacterium]